MIPFDETIIELNVSKMSNQACCGVGIYLVCVGKVTINSEQRRTFQYKAYMNSPLFLSPAKFKT
jgi:hypothetical protein